MKITIERQCGTETVDYRPLVPGEKVMALDVLLQAADRTMPDLAYRYGCRNGLCGVCTIDINGRPRLACRTRVKDGDRLAPMDELPVLADLVVRRDQVNRQLLGRLPVVQVGNAKATKEEAAALDSLNRCIECYACLHNCNLHEKNPKSGPFRYGNPYSFLRIQKVLLNRNASKEQIEQALSLARELGILDYDLKKVPSCGVGIDLKKEVLAPLQKASQ